MKFTFFILGALVLVPKAQAQNFLCHLSITKSDGQSSLCNGVHIGGGRILTAAHCFPEGKRTLHQGIILAKCGNDELMDFIDLRKSKSSSAPSEDIALLTSKSPIKASVVTPTLYPSLYFSAGRINPSATCELFSLRGDYPGANLKRIPLRGTFTLEVRNGSQGAGRILIKPLDGGDVAPGVSVQEGDSGGALVCRFNKKAKPELVGIIATYDTDKRTGKILQMSASPVFGPEAHGLINMTKKY
jgi:hypothetical protein